MKGTHKSPRSLEALCVCNFAATKDISSELRPNVFDGPSRDASPLVMYFARLSPRNIYEGALTTPRSKLSSLSFCDQVVRTDVIAVENCAVISYVPHELFGTGSLSEICVVDQRDGCSLACEPANPCVTKIGFSEVSKLSVHPLQEFDKIRFTGGFVEFLVGCCVKSSVLFRIKLRVELLDTLFRKIHVLALRAA
jgi:hypothetical protein